MRTAIPQVEPFQRVESYLRSVVDAASPGERLPSVRTVMRQCRVSKALADRVLSRFQGEGLIESRPRSGLFRAGRPAVRERVIDYLFFGAHGGLVRGGFHSELIACVAAELAGRSEFLRVRIMRNEPDPQGVVENIIRRDGAEVVTCSLRVSDIPYLKMLRDAGVLCLNLLPNLAEPISPMLSLDDAGMVRGQIEYLTGLGHRRIGYLHSVQEGEFHRPVNHRLDAFYRLAMEYRLEVEPEWVRSVGWDQDRIRSETRVLLAMERRPTALIISDPHVNPVYAELRAGGLTPGVEISVVGTDDLPWAAHVDPPLTSLRVPRTRAARTLCEMLDVLRKGEDPGVRYIETEMMIRRSANAPRS